MTELYCKNCGGSLMPLTDELCKCENCGSTYANISAKKQQELLDSFLDKQKQEQLNSLRRHLWQETTAKFIDSEKITSICLNIKNIYPEDFLANFYEVACGDYEQAVIDFIDSINVKEHHELIEPIINFLIKSLKSEYLLSVNNLIERAYKQSDLQTFNKLTTAFASQAKLVEEGVYELNLPRDVFVAYSSADMSEVQKVVTALESEGLTCFVAMRNLQHGVGAVNNYQQALEKAIDNCKIFLFISSKNSRSFKCDAIKHELPYLKKSDLEQLRYKFPNVDYVKIDNKYKKPRIQLRLDDAKSMADVLVNEIFAGLEYCYDIEGVKERIVKYLYTNNSANVDSVSKKHIKEENAELAEHLIEKEKRFEEQLISQNNFKKQETLQTLTKIKNKNEESSEYFTFTLLKNNTYMVKAKDINNLPTNLVIPNFFKNKAVTEIGALAFDGCKGLISVVIGNNITTIGDCAFDGCSNLLSVVIGDSVTSIGKSAFYCCSRLTTIVIGNSVTSIGNYAFNRCFNLTIYCKRTNKPIWWDSAREYNYVLVYLYRETKPFLGMGKYWHYVNGVPTKW